MCRIITVDNPLHVHCLSASAAVAYNLSRTIQEIRSDFRVDLFYFLNQFNRIRLDTFPTFVLNPSDVVQRLRDLSERYLAIAPFQINQEVDIGNEDGFSNLMLRGVNSLSVGWSTINNKIDITGTNTRRHYYDKLRETSLITLYVNGQKQRVATLKGYRNAVKGIPPPDDLMGRLIKSKLLQGVELTTLTSFLGSRVHQKLMLKSSVVNTNEVSPQPQAVEINIAGYTVKTAVFQLLFEHENQQARFKDQVTAIEDMGSFERLVVAMQIAIQTALAAQRCTILATEVPVFESMKTFSHKNYPI
jgi:hypothetical protein